MDETATAEKSRMDSVDFIFAISISDNTGFIDVANKGEVTANLLYSLREEKPKTSAEIARDSLQEAIRFYKFRQYRLADLTYKWTLQQMERNGLQGDINYFRCLSGKAVVSLALGKTIQTDEELKLAETLVLSKLGKRSAAYAANLNTRAKWNQATGNYNDSEAQFSECLTVCSELFGKGSLQVATVTNNMAMLSLAMGRTEEAVERMGRANELAAAIFNDALKGKKSFERRMFLSNQAMVLQASGDLAGAEKVLNEIRKIYENRGQKANPDYANVLNQLGMLYIRMGKPAQAEPLLKTVGDIYKRHYGEQSPAFGKILHDLSVFCRLTDRLPEAEQYGNRALNVRKAVLGESHPDVARSMEQLGLVYWRQGKSREAYGMLKGAADKSLQFINTYFKPMSEAEQTRYWATLQPGFQRFYAFAIDQEKYIPALRTDVFQYQLATKALLLQSASKTRQAVLAGGDPGLIRDYKEWISRKEMLARYYGLSKEELAKQQIDLGQLEREANALEKTLSQRSSGFSEAFGGSAVTLADLSATLGDQEALVEMVRVNGFDKDFTDDSRYIAMVLVKGAAAPQLKVLRNGRELETRYAKYYRNTVTICVCQYCCIVAQLDYAILIGLCTDNKLSALASSHIRIMSSKFL
ncbi:MAG: tetratricopeptide repeat protein, partial [Bacteroidota bacterium]